MKVGQKVMIKKDLIRRRWYGGLIALEDMIDIAQNKKIYKINSITQGGNYTLEGERFIWSKEMLIPLDQDLKFKVGDMVRVKRNLDLNIPYYMNNGNHGFFTKKMKEHEGKIYKIIKANVSGYKLEDVDLYIFVDDMLEDETYNILPKGTKIVPHSKTAGSRNCHYWEENKHKLGYLYIIDYDHRLGHYIAGVDLDQVNGNFYNREDFALYEETGTITWDDINKEIYIDRDFKTNYKIRLNQLTPEVFLEASKDEDRRVVWLECLNDEHIYGPALTFEQVKEVHKMFGDIITFVEKNREDK